MSWQRIDPSIHQCNNLIRDRLVPVQCCPTFSCQLCIDPNSVENRNVKMADEFEQSRILSRHRSIMEGLDLAFLINTQRSFISEKSNHYYRTFIDWAQLYGYYGSSIDHNEVLSRHRSIMEGLDLAFLINTQRSFISEKSNHYYGTFIEQSGINMNTNRSSLAENDGQKLPSPTDGMKLANDSNLLVEKNIMNANQSSLAENDGQKLPSPSDGMKLANDNNLLVEKNITDSNDTSKMYPVKQESFKCSVCNVDFNSWTKLDRHQRIAHKGYRGYRCMLCDKKYSTENSRVAHWKKEHYSEVLKKFKCDSWNKYIVSKADKRRNHGD